MWSAHLARFDVALDALCASPPLLAPCRPMDGCEAVSVLLTLFCEACAQPATVLLQDGTLWCPRCCPDGTIEATDLEYAWLDDE